MNYNCSLFERLLKKMRMTFSFLEYLFIDIDVFYYANYANEITKDSK